MSKFYLPGMLLLASMSGGCVSSRIAQTSDAAQPTPQTVAASASSTRVTPTPMASTAETPTLVTTTTVAAQSPQSPQSPRTTETVVRTDEPAPRHRSWLEERKHMPWEFALTGSGTNDEEFDVGNGLVNVSVGYYVVPEILELSARQGVFFSDDEGGSTVNNWDFQTTVALDLHFPLGCFVPFVGVNVGYFYGDSDGPDDTLAAGPQAGAKIYLKSDAFLQISAQWEFFEDRETALEGTFDDAFDDGQIFYFAGIGLRF